MNERLPDSGEGNVTVEVTGLSVYTYHGADEAERKIGQRLSFDISFELEHCDAILTDRLEDTVDYDEVCNIVTLAANERSLKTLERLCDMVAERLFERFTTAQEVTVRIAKPSPPVTLPVDEVAVELTKERVDEEEERTSEAEDDEL